MLKNVIAAVLISFPLIAQAVHVTTHTCVSVSQSAPRFTVTLVDTYDNLGDLFESTMAIDHNTPLAAVVTSTTVPSHSGNSIRTWTADGARVEGYFSNSPTRNFIALYFETDSSSAVRLSCQF